MLHGSVIKKLATFISSHFSVTRILKNKGTKQ